MITLPLPQMHEHTSNLCLANLLSIFKEVGIPINAFVKCSAEYDAGVEIADKYLIQISPWDEKHPYAIYSLPCNLSVEPIFLIRNVNELLTFIMETP